MKPMTENEEKQVWELSVPFKDYYRIQEATIILGVAASQIYGYIQKGVVRAYKRNGVLLLSHEGVQFLVRRRERRLAMSETPALIEITG